MNRSRVKLYKALELEHFKWRIAFKGVIVGIVAGLGAVLYRAGIEYGSTMAQDIYSFIKRNPIMIFVWLFAILIAGFAIALMIKKEPMASGSGIPQVEGVLLLGLKMKWYLVLAVRFLGGLLGALFGLSLGREGPSIQIGAASSQGVCEIATKEKLEKPLLITGGAAAGLSAAFNAPLSGVVFALEEVHRSFSPYVMLVAATSSLTGDVVAKIFFGLKPVLFFSQIPQLQIGQYVWLVPASIFFGLVGSFINRMLLWLQSAYMKLPWYLRPCIALFIILPFGLFLPQVLGGGQNLIQLAESTQNYIGVIFVLLVCKIIFTCTSFGSGTPGGIFMPILAVGALSGSLFGIVSSQIGLPKECIPIFAICGMAGALSSAVKAPITSILLTAEMTGSLMHLFPVAACVLIALLVSDLLKIQPIYEALLEKFVGNRDVRAKEEKENLFELPVEMGSSIANKRIKEVELPQGCLILVILRGTKELVPNGNTKMLPSDYLLILCKEENSINIKDTMRELCRFG